MNPKSVKGRMTTAVKKKASIKLPTKRQSSKKQAPNMEVEAAVSLASASTSHREAVAKKQPFKKQQGENVSKVRRFKWTEEDMEAAVGDVISGSISQREAAQKYCVPRATLQKIIKGKTHIGAKPGKKPLFGAELETKLVDYASNRADLGVGFGKKQFLDYAGQLARKHKISLKRSKPSDKWWRLMKRRNRKLVLRRPEGTAAVRHMCMDKTKVDKYFFALKDLLIKSGLLEKTKLIWNMDETGLQLEHVPRTVIARKGSKYLQSRTSGNKETITIIACINASGEKIPPHIIAKGETQRALYGFDLKSAPEGAKWSVSTKGWTKQGIAKLWFETVFLPNIGPERPQVLILDGHDSHNFVELIELAISNRIEIVELPAHTSNWLQPCDRTVFKPLKDAYNEVCQELTNGYPGVVVSKANFCGLLSKAWNKALSVDNIISGFKACGIYPFNPDQIPQQAYAPSSLYVVEEQEDVSQKTVETEVIVHDNTTPAAVHVTEMQDAPAGENPSTTVKVVDVQEVMTDEQYPTERPCSSRMALSAVESAFTATQLDSFSNAYISGYDEHLKFDRLYLTWKGLKEAVDTEAMVQMLEVSVKSVDTVVLETVINTQGEADMTSVIALDDIDKILEGQNVTSDGMIIDAPQPSPELPAGGEMTHVDEGLASTPIRPVLFPFQNTSSPLDVDSDVLPYPKPQIRKRKRDGKKSNTKFFVLTSEEAYQSKLSEQATKVQREKEKLEKQRKVKERRELKDKENIAKAKKQSFKRKPSSSASASNSKQKRKRREENWQCFECHGLYFDSQHSKYKEDWVVCVECHKKNFHNSCAITHGRFDNDDINGDFTCFSCFADAN